MTMDRFFQSLVRILSEDRQPPEPVGAGVLVSERHVFSCAHVIADALRIPRITREKPTATVWLDRPLTPAARPLTARIDTWHPLKDQLQLGEIEDFAVLTLDTPPALQPVAVQFIALEKFIDRPVRLFGFPQGKGNGTWIRGETKGPIGNGWIQLDNELGRHGVTPGFSGAPIWDDQAQAVVGMMVGTPVGETDTAYMIPAGTLAKAWPPLTTEADAVTQEHVVSFDFSGKNQLEFKRRLSTNWRDLATILEIPTHEQARFDRGDEADGIWNWLAKQDELARLPSALEDISRADLAKLFSPAQPQPKTGAVSRVGQAKRQALEQRLQSLIADYQSVTEKLITTLDPADKSRLQRQSDALERDMQQIERQLDTLD